MGDTSWNRRYNLGNDYGLDHGYDQGDTLGNGLPSPITTDTEKTVFLCFNFWWAAVSVQRHAKSWYRNANVGCQCLLVSLVMVALWQEARLLRDSVRLIFAMNNWKIKKRNIQHVLGCHFHTSIWGQMVFKRRVVVRFINLTRVAPHLRIGVDPLGCRPFVAPENYYTIAPGNQAT